VATQFHLEKSGRPGLRMLQNFCRGPWPETTC
jgi:imidazoleglycerol phosphate synthase glutamine amidotransferase subunit HisH